MRDGADTVGRNLRNIDRQRLVTTNGVSVPYRATRPQIHQFSLNNPSGRGSSRSNLPAWKTIKIDIDHIVSGHTSGGSRAMQSQIKDVFPDNWTEKQIETAILEAYRFGSRVQTQGNRVRGYGNNRYIEMWVNLETKQIEMVYPID